MLMRYLSEPEASSASALSIRRLCDGCAALLVAGSMEPLMGLYRQIQGSGDVAHNTLDLDLDEDDVQQVRGLWVGARGGGLTGSPRYAPLAQPSAATPSVAPPCDPPCNTHPTPRPRS